MSELAHRPQDQPCACGAKEPADRQHEDQRDVDQRAVAEHHPQHRVACKAVWKHRAEHVHRAADEAAACQCRQADAENGQRQTGCHLVGGQREREEAEDQRGSRRCQHGRQHPDDRLTGESGYRKAGDGTDQHHAFDTEVEHAGFLHHKFAKGRQQDGRGGPDDAHDDRYQQPAGHDASFASVREPRRTR